MMSLKKKIINLAKAAAKTEGDSEFISSCMDKLTNYHNVVVTMEKNISIQKFRLESSDFQEWLSVEDERRILAHKSMIDAVIVLNRYSKINGLDLFYEDYVDEDLRYNDSDTRFGIAAFSDVNCHELFLEGTNEIVYQKNKELLERYEALPNKENESKDCDEYDEIR